jgi:hypothetical protein
MQQWGWIEPFVMTIYANQCIKTARTMRNINVNYATEHTTIVSTCVWRAKQKRVENTHTENNGCLRLGVVRTDIDDTIVQQMHQNSENHA